MIEALEARRLLVGAPQTIGLKFLGAEASEGSALEPDSAGAVGPTQVLLAVEGRIKAFSKSTGGLDGALNTTTDLFFDSVRGGASTGREGRGCTSGIRRNPANVLMNKGEITY